MKTFRIGILREYILIGTVPLVVHNAMIHEMNAGRWTPKNHHQNILRTKNAQRNSDEWCVNAHTMWKYFLLFPYCISYWTCCLSFSFFCLPACLTACRCYCSPWCVQCAAVYNKKRFPSGYLSYPWSVQTWHALRTISKHGPTTRNKNSIDFWYTKTFHSFA